MKKLLFSMLVLSCYACFGMRNAKDFSKEELKKVLNYMQTLKTIDHISLEKFNEKNEKIFNVMKDMANLYNLPKDINSISFENFELGSTALSIKSTLFNSEEGILGFPKIMLFAEKDLLCFAENFREPLRSFFWFSYLTTQFSKKWIEHEESVLNELLKKPN